MTPDDSQPLPDAFAREQAAARRHVERVGGIGASGAALGDPETLEELRRILAGLGIDRRHAKCRPRLGHPVVLERRAEQPVVTYALEAWRQDVLQEASDEVLAVNEDRALAADDEAELQRIKAVFHAQLKRVAPDLQLPF